MDPGALGVLAAAAVVTSAFTAAVGIGGGIVLLALMLLYLEPLVAIPVHGAVQLASNATRTAIQREHVRWPLVARFAPGLVPAGVLGIWLLQDVPPTAARAAIGVFVLAALWAPRVLLLGLDPAETHPTRRFVWLGLGVGFLNTTVGATGPVQGPFYRGIGLSRHAIVGTFAAAQSLGHVVKIALFAGAGFVFAPWALPLAVLVVCVWAGTWLGSHLLERLDERTFHGLYRVTLTAVALRLAVWEPWLALR
jgi:uncharacterized membrane protein YfcA